MNSYSSGSDEAENAQYMARLSEAAVIVDNHIQKRIDYHSADLNDKHIVLQLWRSLDFNKPLVSEGLFVIFSKNNLPKLCQFEHHMSSGALFSNHGYLNMLKSEFDELAETDLHLDFVVESVSRRKNHLNRELIIRDLLIDCWRGLNTQSVEIVVQMETLFELNDEAALIDYEISVLLGTPRVLNPNLRYFSPIVEIMPDGSEHYGVYKIIDTRTGFKLCVIDLEFLNVDVFIDYHEWILLVPCVETTTISQLSSMPSFQRTDSLESIMPQFRRNHSSVSSSVSNTSIKWRSVFSAKPSASESNLYPYLKQREVPQIRSCPSVSLTEVATYVEKSRLALNSNIPEGFFRLLEQDTKVDEDKNEAGPSTSGGSTNDGTRVVANGQAESAAQQSQSQENGLNFKMFQHFDANILQEMYLQFEEKFEPENHRDAESLATARKVLKWIIRIIEQQKLLHIAVKVFMMARRELSDEELLLLLYFNSIRDITGSANFILFMLDQKVADR